MAFIGTDQQPLVVFFEDMAVKDAMLLIHEYAKADYPLNPLFLIDRQGRLAGMVNLNSVLSADDATQLYELKEDECLALYADTSQKDTKTLFQVTSAHFFPVVTEERHLIGIVHQDSY